MTAKPGDRPWVVLVHGVLMSGWIMRVLAGRLRAHGFRCRCFSYPSRHQDIAENADALARYIRDVGQGAPVHVVAHSLGGLIALRMATAMGAPPLGRMVALAPPFHGSRIARRVVALPGGRWLLGKSLAGALLGSGPNRAPDGMEVGVITGTLALEANLLFGALPGPNDGTVAADETQLDNETDRVDVHVSHTPLVFSKNVATLTARFLKAGRF